jgi:hypothetical protein
MRKTILLEAATSAAVAATAPPTVAIAARISAAKAQW